MTRTRRRPVLVDELRLQLELAELEAGGYAYALAAPPPGDPVGRRRDRLPHEAHVDFDGIERDLDATRDRCAGIALRLRPLVLDRLLMHVDDASSSPLATITRLDVEGAGAITGLPMLIAHAAAQIAVELHDAAARAAARVHAELIASGLPGERLRPLLARSLAAPAAGSARGLRAGTVDALDAQALRVAAAPVSQLLDAAQTTAAAHTGPGTTPEAVAAALADTAARLSDRGIVDVANQAANRAGGFGRSDGADDVDFEAVPGAVEGAPPGGPGGAGAVLIYASELIDRSTCYPCALVDGTEYDTEAAAAVDYPFGQYAACLGGSRCRGMLVYVWSPEAPATIGLPR